MTPEFYLIIEQDNKLNYAFKVGLSTWAQLKMTRQPKVKFFSPFCLLSPFSVSLLQQL